MICGLVVLLLGTGIAGTACAQDEAPLRRGSWAAFTTETEVLAASGEVIRKASEGEVVRIRILRDGWAEVGSSVPELPGGKVSASALRPATPEENEAWVAAGKALAAQAASAAAPLEAAPAPDEEAALEAAEPPAGTIPPASLNATTVPTSPIIGWFDPARSIRITSMALGNDGSIYLAGALKYPIHTGTARGWNGSLPAADPDNVDVEFAFLARITPNLASLPDFVVFDWKEVKSLRLLRTPPVGEGIWIAGEDVSGAVGGHDADKARRTLLHFSTDLRKVIRAVPLLHSIEDFVIDAAGRPFVLRGAEGRGGGGFLTRSFSAARYERLWPDAPDGPTRRLALDFSSPALSEGPFALWAKKSETLPDFPTPLAPWGSPPNGNQSISWTNVKSHRNPIRGANMMPEMLALDREGNILVSGTIPFEMGFPDFDPFLLKFSPSGKLLWNNCFLSGLLSEPDQKPEALIIDPSNGDILISYWQHGNNNQTLLLDPNGWLTKFTGTSGNIKIPWIGRVDPATGRLKNSTYIFSHRPQSRNPRWPDLNSVDLNALGADPDGRVYAAGGTTVTLPTTSNALIPRAAEYGGYPFLCVMKPDLSGPVYSTYLSPGQGGVRHLVVPANQLAIVAGDHKTSGPPPLIQGLASAPYLTDQAPQGEEGTFLAILPIPAEAADWSFKH